MRTSVKTTLDGYLETWKCARDVNGKKRKRKFKKKKYDDEKESSM